MKALTYQGIRKVSVERVDDPEILNPTDAIVKVHRTAVCGSDLHVWHGRESGLDSGTIMGHEFCGEVVEVGSGLTQIRKGDQVVSPFTTSCGQCFYCRQGLTARCTSGELFGWVEDGKGLHGTQAEFVRVPLADSSLVPYSKGLDPSQALLAGDILATGWHCAVQAGIRPDQTYVILGSGPVGLMALIAAKALGAEKVIAVDGIGSRREKAASLGALTASPEEALSVVKEHTEGRGADAVMEAVGSKGASRLAVDLLRPGGTYSSVGVHTDASFAFSPIEAYDKNLTFRFGRCPARHYMPDLLKRLEEGALPVEVALTHHWSLDQAAEAYNLFDRKADGCVKIILDPGIGHI